MDQSPDEFCDALPVSAVLYEAQLHRLAVMLPELCVLAWSFPLATLLVILLILCKLQI
jgi:hypothetical protein